MGEVTWLTWPKMTCIKKSRYTKCQYSVPMWEFIFLRKIAYRWQRCDVAALCDRAEGYLWHHRWPNLKMNDMQCPAWMGGGQSCKISALSQTAAEQSWENRLGVATLVNKSNWISEYHVKESLGQNRPSAVHVSRFLKRFFSKKKKKCWRNNLQSSDALALPLT